VALGFLGDFNPVFISCVFLAAYVVHRPFVGLATILYRSQLTISKAFDMHFDYDSWSY
jgi:hypothetical protein